LPILVQQLVIEKRAVVLEFRAPRLRFPDAYDRSYVKYSGTSGTTTTNNMIQPNREPNGSFIPTTSSISFQLGPSYLPQRPLLIVQ
jgi:hypothetical protein